MSGVILVLYLCFSPVKGTEALSQFSAFYTLSSSELGNSSPESPLSNTGNFKDENEEAAVLN